MGSPIELAVHKAQQFTWHSLRDGEAIGHGQHLPNRRNTP
jgi:hydroxymethylpyrimidine/phosphomethylpyrimidine kinase